MEQARYINTEQQTLSFNPCAANTQCKLFDFETMDDMKQKNIYQRLVNHLLSVESYDENMLSFASDIPTNVIRGLRLGLIKDPGDAYIGRLVRFYLKMA
jgi:hypothetical protein